MPSFAGKFYIDTHSQGYPPAEALEDAIQQALDANETASRVRYIHDVVRNHPDFQVGRAVSPSFGCGFGGLLRWFVPMVVTF